VSEQAQRPAQDMTTRELAAQLSEQTSRLVKDEIALAKAELFASSRQAALGGGLLTAAAVVGGTAWLAAVAAAIAGIAVALPVWAAALIVCGLFAALAGGLALLGRRRLACGMPPLTLTVGSIRDDLTDLATRVRVRR
jgi:Putative Actinobacterial Holin-X, holin superfamily III